jgi:preprotein translocase subunit SecA
LPRALAAAGNLAEDEHFRIDRARRDLRLTEAGRRRLTEDLAGQGDPWPVRGTREHLVSQALRALHLFERDRHYLVDAEGQVQIIDEYTGRVLDGRTWEQGLHQLIECKEGVALSERTRTLARITYQRYFTRYLRLAGMTGTSREVARELSVVYRLPTVVIPTHRPGQRHQRPARCCPGRDGVWQAVAEIAAAAHAQGQPVLAGTRTLADSEALSACLRARGVPHRVLNARQDAEEAALVAQAGQRGAITVATNMAGRGTDIELGEGVAALGGLLVLLTGYHESSRIDRQLFGRGARQGQPGAAQAVVARDDELFVQHGGLWGLLLQRMAAAPGWLQRRVLNRTRCAAQRRAEAQHARTRRDVTRQDRQLEQQMGYAGTPI